MRKILLVIIGCLFGTIASTQEQQPFFYQIFADNGLSSDKTTRVIQDHQGFVWIGTEEGLNRIGDYFQIEKFRFDRNDSSSLSEDYITALYVDSRNRFWVGTRNGLNLYQRETKSFLRVSTIHSDGHEHGIHINDILEDENRDLWVICRDHLVRIKGDDLTEQETVFVEDKGLNLVRLALFETRLRLGTSKGIYTLVDGELHKSGMAKDLPVTDLLTVENELFIATASNGVLRHNAISGNTTVYNKYKSKTRLVSNHVNDLALVDKNELWVSTISGVTTMNLNSENTRHFYYDFDNAFSLSDRVIRQAYQDRAGIVWLTTPNSGVNYFHAADNLFGYYGQSEEQGTSKDLMDYGILSIYTEGDEAWLGSRKGISHLKNGRFQHYPFDPRMSIWATGVFDIERDKRGLFWLATDNGLINWDSNTGKYKRFDHARLNNRNVTSLAVTANNELWIGTEENGLKVLDLSSQTLTHLSDIPNPGTNSWPAIESILPLPEEGMLIGTRSGLYQIKDQEIEKVPLNVSNNDLSNDLIINTLQLDENANVLVGTKHDGLIILDQNLKPLFRAGKKEGMASMDVRAIISGVDEALWVSTNAGVSRLTKVENSITKIKNFDIQDGLQSNHFSERSASQLANGQILMGGLSGLTFFHPDDILDFEITQNLNFVSLSVKGDKMKIGAEGSPLQQDMTVSDKLVLETDQNHFTIAFSALDYTRPSDVIYRYQLKGHNSEWTELKNSNSVTYQNLAGGRSYTFMVQSKGRFSEWSASKELKIYVEPYYYETLWFQLIAIVLFVVFIGLFVWWRANIASIKKRELEQLIVDRSAALQEEVGIRRETEKQLKEALAQAERASEVKSQFLANMSHEIRTPLNGIMGMTELSMQTKLDEEQHTMLDTIYKSTHSLKSIVDDILDIAKIEAGVLKMVNERYKVQDVLDQAMSSFQLQANQKGLSLKHWVLPKVPAHVLGDAGRLRQVLVNLVANAMKFTHRGSITVIVDAMNQSANGMELWFTITDTGIGIPEYQQENIFKSFMQVESGPSRAFGGTGLGLSISKELVEKMGGEIWVESEEGKGSIFSFYIRVEEFTSEEAHAQPVVEVEKSFEQLSGKVLIVEDIVTNQLVTAKMSEKMGLTPTCVDSGREALSLLKKAHFDLVLMDLQMPEIDGLGITRLIRSAVIANQNVPIVAVTASASDEIKERCLAAGMNGYLAKPVTMKELYETIQALLSRKESDPA